MDSGDQSLFMRSYSHDQDAAMPMCGKNPLKFFFRGSDRQMAIGLGILL